MKKIKNTILSTVNRQGGVLLDLENPMASQRIRVPVDLVHEYQLCRGVTITGTAEETDEGLVLSEVQKVCGLSPSKFQKRIPFNRLVAINPEERFDFSSDKAKSMRIIDMFAPIGKGMRAMIVSPPKAGKTRLLEEMAHAINEVSPETRIIALLIDERPEEVTHFKREINAEVFSSTIDKSVNEHVFLTNLILAHIQTELECGRDIVVLVDSLTRIGRAFNAAGQGTGKVMSGGLSAGAMEIPRRFFGLARNIEHGGSVTMIATALIDTGSRMDQLIFEEFKGTGNCEIVLDRGLADHRIFPAINILKSGSRRDEMLLDPDDYERIIELRRSLAEMEPGAALKAALQEVKGKHSA